MLYINLDIIRKKQGQPDNTQALLKNLYNFYLQYSLLMLHHHRLMTGLLQRQKILKHLLNFVFFNIVSPIQKIPLKQDIVKIGFGGIFANSNFALYVYSSLQ